MKNNIKGIKDRIICSKLPFVSFFTSSKPCLFLSSFKDPGDRELVFFLDNRKADYLILDERSFSDPVPDHKPTPYIRLLLNEKETHSALTKVYTIKKPKKIILYKVERAKLESLIEERNTLEEKAD